MTTRIKFQRADMVSALKAAASAADTRSTLPLLGCVLLRSAAGAPSLSVVGTDLNTAVTTEVPAEMSGAVDLAIPLRDIQAPVSAYAAGGLILEVDGLACKLHPDGRPRDAYRFTAFQGKDFPKLPKVPALQRVDSAALCRLLEGCRPAAAVEETRAHLHGVYLSQQDATFVGVATDGHRLHVIERKLAVTWPTEGTLIPSRAVDALLRIAAGRDVDIAFSAPWLFAVAGATTLAAKAANVTYPAWQQVIPAASGGVEVDAVALTSALSRVGVVVSGKDGTARLVCAAGTLTLTAADTEGREMVAEVECGPGSFEVVVCVRYAVNALDAMESETVLLQVSDPRMPLLMTATTGGARAVVMPVVR